MSWRGKCLQRRLINKFMRRGKADSTLLDDTQFIRIVVKNKTKNQPRTPPPPQNAGVTAQLLSSSLQRTWGTCDGRGELVPRSCSMASVGKDTQAWWSEFKSGISVKGHGDGENWFYKAVLCTCAHTHTHHALVHNNNTSIQIKKYKILSLCREVITFICYQWECKMVRLLYNPLTKLRNSTTRYIPKELRTMSVQKYVCRCSQYIVGD